VALVGVLGTTTLACTVAPANGTTNDANGGNGAGANNGNGTQPGAQAQGVTCAAVADCASNCAENDQACEDACIAKGSPEARKLVSALTSCFQTNNCQDAACVQSKCSAEVQACVTQKAAASSSTSPSAGNTPKGNVPAELVGTWTHTSRLGNSSYTFNADGTLVRAMRVETNYGCPTITEYASTGTVVFDGPNLTVYENQGTETSLVCSSTGTTKPISPSQTSLSWRWGQDSFSGETRLYLKLPEGESDYTNK
jgi:hypothetical protein